MPKTALGFLVGAVAICGLPPLNGFVSEFFLYIGLFRSTLLRASGVWVAGVLGAPALAIIGALAVACFVKVFGAVFLGAPRSGHVRDAREAGASMTAPMLMLGACCIFIGLVPPAIAPALDHAVAAWAPEATNGEIGLASLAPLGWLSALAITLMALLAGGFALFAARVRPSRAAMAVTWDCGYAAPSSRMQYTASSFAESLVGIFSWALHPRVHPAKPVNIFPRAEHFKSEVPDPVLDRAVLPASHQAGRFLVWFRWVQHGDVQLYIFYVLAALVLTMLLRR